MNVLDQFLVSVLKNRDIENLAKLNKVWMDSDEFKRYRFVTDYYKENNELPGVRSYCSMYKVDATDVDSKPTLYLNKVKERYITSEILENIPSLIKKAKDAPTKTLSDLKSLLASLSIEESTGRDVNYSDKATSRYEDYKLRKEKKGVTYLSMGHPVLDRIFMGYGKHDLVTIGGRAGSKKTFQLIYLAQIMEEFIPEEYGDILFISNEMAEDLIIRRGDAIKFKLPYERFLRGELNRHETRKYIDGLKELETKKSRIKILYNCRTIDELTFKIGLYKPSIVFIDGSYLMEPGMKEGWEKITFITRQLKQLTKDFGNPIINTTQLKRASGKGEKSTSFDAQDDFAYSNSFVQDSDVAIRMFQDKDMIYRQEIGIQIAKGREVSAEIDLVFKANLETMEFDYIEKSSDTTDEIIEY